VRIPAGAQAHAVDRAIAAGRAGDDIRDVMPPGREPEGEQGTLAFRTTVALAEAAKLMPSAERRLAAISQYFSSISIPMAFL